MGVILSKAVRGSSDEGSPSHVSGKRRVARCGHWVLWSALCLWGALTVGCAAPTTQTRQGFTLAALRNHRVLLMPLAVSDPLGDDRTGIVLENRSILRAGRAACTNIAEELDEIGLLCFDDKALRGTRRLLQQVSHDFATDKVSPGQSYQTLARSSGARYLLLFRPESVEAINKWHPGAGGASYATLEPSRTNIPNASRVTNNAVNGAAGAVAQIVAEAIFKPGYTARRKYEISAALVDMQTGSRVKVGQHAAAGSKASGRSKDFPEPDRILANAMTALAEAMLCED